MDTTSGAISSTQNWSTLKTLYGREKFDLIITYFELTQILGIDVDDSGDPILDR